MMSEPRCLLLAGGASHTWVVVADEQADITTFLPIAVDVDPNAPNLEGAEVPSNDLRDDSKGDPGYPTVSRTDQGTIAREQGSQGRSLGRGRDFHARTDDGLGQQSSPWTRACSTRSTPSSWWTSPRRTNHTEQAQRMKLIRIGARSAEHPALLGEDGTVLGLSGLTADIDGAFLVIGRTARYLDTPASALDHLAGYAISNDVSEREFQPERSNHWDLGKSEA